jgi:hypothetical protein
MTTDGRVHFGFRVFSFHWVPYCADKQADRHVGLPVGALEPFKKKEPPYFRKFSRTSGSVEMRTHYLTETEMHPGRVDQRTSAHQLHLEENAGASPMLKENAPDSLKRVAAAERAGRIIYRLAKVASEKSLG